MHGAETIFFLALLGTVVLGSVFLAAAPAALARVRHELTRGAMLWTCGAGAMTLWSVMTLTNARMLLIAFPAVIVWARILPPRRHALFLGAEAALLVLTSGLTLAGLMLPLGRGRAMAARQPAG